MIDKDLVKRNIDYIKYNDRTFHEVYVAIMISEVMNVPIDWIDNEKLEKVSTCIEKAIESNKIFNEEFRKKIMDIEKEIEMEKMPWKNNELDLIDRILYRHKIYDIELEYDKDNNVVAKDDSNVWVGKEFYDFLYNEVFNFNDNGTLDLVVDEDLKN